MGIPHILNTLLYPLVLYSKTLYVLASDVFPFLHPTESRQSWFTAWQVSSPR